MFLNKLNCVLLNFDITALILCFFSLIDFVVVFLHERKMFLQHLSRVFFQAKFVCSSSDLVRNGPKVFWDILLSTMFYAYAVYYFSGSNF